ncbi:hypothetical protein A2U01_0081125, partial [Trifolium medium]|nr:hypothetical protein [Trifolium medium]
MQQPAAVVTLSTQEEGRAVHEVAWEVEVEAEALAKLNGAFVGFLAENTNHQLIQQNFLMDGYHNMRVLP